MVDLHHSLRPTGAVSPLPISEIAVRVKRRKRRRLITTTGMAFAALGIGVLAINNLPVSQTDTVTVADGAYVEVPDTPTDGNDDLPSSVTTLPGDKATTSSEDTDSEATDSTVSSTSSVDVAPQAAESTETDPMTTPGIRTSETTTSQWEDGYCIQVEVINDTGDGNAWQVVLDLGGTIDTLWNATAVQASSGTFVFSGQDGYNTTIARGAVTSFGTCVDTGAS